MSHCSQQKRGNIFESQRSPDDNQGDWGPPYVGSVEKTCRDDSGRSYSHRYASYASNVRPENSHEIARTLEHQVNDGKPGLLGNVANVFKSVFGRPTEKIQHSLQQQEREDYLIQDQVWPNPTVTDEQINSSDQHQSKGGSGSRSRVERTEKRRRSKSLKKRKSNVHKKSQRKRSTRKLSKRTTR